MPKRVLIAMSGGVDSAAAAFLLKHQGYDVTGATMLLYHNEQSCEEARESAKRIGIPHETLDFSARFAKDVIGCFIDGYRRGDTPNPCVDCNRSLKFGALLDWALDADFDYVATGHYARIEYDDESERYLLKKSAHTAKDQSYVLYSLDQRALSHTLFPLGDLSKEEVRAIAAEGGFVAPEKAESQDICFVPDGDYLGFIEQYAHITPKPGNFIDLNGTILGQHRGILSYTVGQRKGLGIAFGKPMYVCDKDAVQNTVTLGEEDALYSDTMRVNRINLIPWDHLPGVQNAIVKTRYRQHGDDATLEQQGGDDIEVRFQRPQKAIARGQAAVFYRGDYVLGGGTIL